MQEALYGLVKSGNKCVTGVSTSTCRDASTCRDRGRGAMLFAKKRYSPLSVVPV